MNEAEIRAALHRVLALRYQMEAGKHQVAASAVVAAASMRRFATAFQDGIDRDVATHPDLAELNVQMGAWYA